MVGAQGQTELAIVRTGSYINYGFGGFVYQRNGGVVLPTGGQAIFNGDYAALVDFKGTGGIQYVRGSATIAVDFDDFNNGPGAVRGAITNRTVFDTAGNDVTSAVLTELGTANNATYTQLPTLIFDVGPGVIDSQGEATGTLQSTVVDGSGAGVQYENGNYYAILSGDLTQTDAANPGQVVGIVVVESTLAGSSITRRETGGFIGSR